MLCNCKILLDSIADPAATLPENDLTLYLGIGVALAAVVLATLVLLALNKKNR